MVCNFETISKYKIEMHAANLCQSFVIAKFEKFYVRNLGKTCTKSYFAGLIGKYNKNLNTDTSTLYMYSTI